MRYSLLGKSGIDRYPWYSGLSLTFVRKVFAVLIKKRLAGRVFMLVYLGIWSLAIQSCSKYSLEINNNRIYTPPPVYQNFELADQALNTCIQQTIIDHQLSRASDLHQVKCSYAGIESIQGLAHFSRIQELSLKGNPIDDGNELLKLTHLKYLDVRDTGIFDCQLISQLSGLLNGPEVTSESSFFHSAQC